MACCGLSSCVCAAFVGRNADRPAIFPEHQPETRFLDYAPYRRKVVRNWRSLAFLEIADGRKPDARASREFLLCPPQPSAGGSALLRAHDSVNRIFFAHVNEID